MSLFLQKHPSHGVGPKLDNVRELANSVCTLEEYVRSAHIQALIQVCRLTDLMAFTLDLKA